MWKRRSLELNKMITKVETPNTGRGEKMMIDLTHLTGTMMQIIRNQSMSRRLQKTKNTLKKELKKRGTTTKITTTTTTIDTKEIFMRGMNQK